MAREKRIKSGPSSRVAFFATEWAFGVPGTDLDSFWEAKIPSLSRKKRGTRMGHPRGEFVSYLKAFRPMQRKSSGIPESGYNVRVCVA
jgi:hypothetical protein